MSCGNKYDLDGATENFGFRRTFLMIMSGDNISIVA